MSSDLWAELQRLTGDLSTALDNARSTANVCATKGHQYQLHATKTAPTRVSCKRCPKTWTVTN